MKISFNMGNNNNNIGKTIEEKMKTYETMKEAAREITKNKARYNESIQKNSWGKILIAVLVFGICGVLMLFVGVNETKKAMNTEGKVYTIAEIKSIWSTRTEGAECRLELEYDLDGKTYEATLYSNKERSEFNTGDMISIYFYEDQPNIAYHTGGAFAGITLVIAGGVFIIIAFIIIFKKVTG